MAYHCPNMMQRVARLRVGHSDVEVEVSKYQELGNQTHFVRSQKMPGSYEKIKYIFSVGVVL